MAAMTIKPIVPCLKYVTSLSEINENPIKEMTVVLQTQEKNIGMMPSRADAISHIDIDFVLVRESDLGTVRHCSGILPFCPKNLLAFPLSGGIPRITLLVWMVCTCHRRVGGLLLLLKRIINIQYAIQYLMKIEYFVGA